MRELKVGDRIKNVTPESFSHLLSRVNNGKFGNTTFLSSGSVDIKYDDGNLGGLMVNDMKYSNQCYELIEESKPQATQKFKVGDKCKVINIQKKNNFCGERGVKLGEIVTYNDKNEGTFCPRVIKENGDSAVVWEFNLELVESCDSCEETCEETSKVECGHCSYCKNNNINEPINSSRNKVEKIMSNITKFVKESFLSADEKLLRKVGLKDSCGEFTSTAQELVLEKLVRENEAYLVETAKAMEAEEKANK